MAQKLSCRSQRGEFCEPPQGGASARTAKAGFLCKPNTEQPISTSQPALPPVTYSSLLRSLRTMDNECFKVADLAPGAGSHRRYDPRSRPGRTILSPPSFGSSSRAGRSLPQRRPASVPRRLRPKFLQGGRIDICRKNHCSAPFAAFLIAIALYACCGQPRLRDGRPVGHRFERKLLVFIAHLFHRQRFERLVVFSDFGAADGLRLPRTSCRRCIRALRPSICT